MRDRILVIDDEPNLLKILSALLEKKGYDVYSFPSFEMALPTLNTENIDAVITDLSMPEKTGMDVLNYCKQYTPDLPVIMITAFGTIEAAVSALKAGAFDFVLKPFNQEDLFSITEKAIQSRKRHKREPALEIMSATGVGPVPVPLFGDQPQTKQLRMDVERISKSRSHCLILGEVGTGKRSVAYEIHRHSDRARGPFVQLHCEAIPESFQISELFGIERGANPLAFVSRPGRLELVQGGTLLLDEITALSVEAQNALFTALENEKFSRLGGVKIFPFDLRLIVTSSKPGAESIESLFRRDQFHPELFHKITVEQINLQPLRERKLDLVSHLIPHFLERSCSKKAIPTVALGPTVLHWFTSQNWNGNLGELEKKIEQLVNQAEEATNRALIETLPSGW